MNDKDYNTGCPNGCGLYFAAGVGQDGGKCPTIGCDGVLVVEDCEGCEVCITEPDGVPNPEIDCGVRPLSHTDPASLKFGDLKAGRTVDKNPEQLFPKPDKEAILAEVAKKS
jgi:hypothetical protein